METYNTITKKNEKIQNPVIVHYPIGYKYKYYIRGKSSNGTSLVRIISDIEYIYLKYDGCKETSLENYTNGQWILQQCKETLALLQIKYFIRKYLNNLLYQRFYAWIDCVKGMYCIDSENMTLIMFNCIKK